MEAALPYPQRLPTEVSDQFQHEPFAPGLDGWKRLFEPGQLVPVDRGGPVVMRPGIRPGRQP